MNNWISVKDRFPKWWKVVRVYSPYWGGFTDAVYAGCGNWHEASTALVIPDVTKWCEMESDRDTDNAGWISVKEALPEPDTKCLVWDGQNVRMFYIRPGCDSRHLIEFDHLTHWQPLPDPPKPAGPFHIVPTAEDPPHVWELHHATFGWVCGLAGEAVSKEACSRLNELWALEKGSKDV